MERLETFKRILPKLTAFNSKPDAKSFPELPDVLVWTRFVIALVYGLKMGYMSGYQGGAGIMFGLNLITFVPFIYVSNFLGANAESYAGLTFAGVPQSFALFLLVWIYFFSQANEVDEMKLVMALLQEQGVVEDGGSMDTGAEEQATTFTETDSEF